MTVNMTCKHCAEVITAEDEDALVELVQTHARSHGGGTGPLLSRGHILSRFHRLQRRHSAEA